jgi:oligopeptide/dipeptide ABC transporter ATP-binding protein
MSDEEWVPRRSQVSTPQLFSWSLVPLQVRPLRKVYTDCVEILGNVHECNYDLAVSDLLHVRAFTVELPTPLGWIRPVNDISLRIAKGESLGLVGESGSGKTMLSLALMGLLPIGACVSGEAIFDAEESSPKNLAKLDDAERRAVRGREIAMVFQEPMTSLNPVMRVGSQIEEAIRAHEPGIASSVLHRRLLSALGYASVPEPEIRAKQFPHQLSGGLRQRVMIAMALAGRPKLLIADEPTTALDVTVQQQILELLDRLRREMELGLLFITHDLGVVAKVAERVAVMYAGRIVEEGATTDVLTSPRHPYTQGLLAASPSLRRAKLSPIPGTVPQLTALPPGCSFAPRCSFHRAECDEALPELRLTNQGQSARCVLV